MESLKKVYLLTGSNLGDSVKILGLALKLIERDIGNILKKSSIYRSDPWGYTSENKYYNQCVEVETAITPEEFLKRILKIEEDCGRKRNVNDYTDRELDIDILFWNNEIIHNNNLVIPHPRLHLRKFALVPMVEIAGDMVHPVFGKSISDLLEKCPDPSVIIEIPYSEGFMQG